MKKVIIMITIFMLLLTSIMPIVSADETDILADGYIEINAKDFVSSTAGIQIDSNRWVCFRDSKWAEYEVTVSAEGEYYLYIHSSTNATQDSNLGVSVGGEEQFARKVPQTAGLGSPRINYLGKMTLTEGDNTIRISSLGNLSYVDKLYIATTPIYIRAEGENVINATNFTSAAPTQRNEKGFAVMHGSSSSGWYEYLIYAEKEGTAELSIATSGTTNIKVIPTINDKSESEVLLEGTGAYGSAKTSEIERIKLNEGLNVIRFEITSGGCYFHEIFIEYLKPIEITKISALGEYDISTGEIPRETDFFEIEFSKEVLNDSVNETSVKLLKGNVPIKTEINAEGNVITVCLKETLDYGETYSLVLDGVFDTEEFSSVKNEINEFAVKDASAMIKNASVSINEADMVYEKATISGTVYSSKNVPLSGRKLSLEILSPKLEKIDIEEIEIVSDENGSFYMESEIPKGSAYGVYTFNISCEHGKDSAQVQLFYVSETLEGDILSEFNNVTDSAEAESLLKEYEEELDINLEKDLSGIDTSDFYKQFKGQTHSTVYGLRDYYYASAVMCKIRTAEVPNQIEVLMTEENCKYLGIEYGKLELIENNISDFYIKVMSLDRNIMLPEFKKEISDCIEKALMKEYGKEESELAISDVKIYVGQSAEISLVFKDKLTDFDKAVLVVKADDVDFFDDIDVTTKEKGWEINKTEDCLEIITTEVQLDNKTLGKLFLTGFEAVDTYNLSVSGEVYYDLSIAYPIIAPIAECEFEIDVVKKQQSGGGSGGKDSSFHSSGTSGGKSAITTPEPTDPEPTTPPSVSTETEFKFADLASVNWAEEAIYGLLERGAISKSDDKCFYPENNVKRSEFIKMLVVALGIEDENAETDFADVKEESWYYTTVASAQKYGLIIGDENGCFNPESYITRENIAVIMARVYEIKGHSFDLADKNDIFTDDSQIADYAKVAVYNMQSIGVINGMGDGTFAPKDSATRAQTAKMIYKTIMEVGA